MPRCYGLEVQLPADRDLAGLEQLPKRSILHLNMKLPMEPCSNDQLHLRLSLPVASPQLVACETMCIHVNHRENKRAG